MGNADVLLTHQVIARIVGSAGLRGERITVRVQNRVVILLGAVRSAAARREATDRARSTPGVEDVCDRLAGPAEPDTFDEMVAMLAPRPVPTPEPAWRTFTVVTLIAASTILLISLV